MVVSMTYYALFHLIAFRGLRQGEACGQNRTEPTSVPLITVAKQLVVDGWEVYEDDHPKTDAGARTTVLDSDTVLGLPA